MLVRLIILGGGVTTTVEQALDNKVDKEEGKGLFSGSYNDLDDKPTIPVVPTNISAFNNDSGYITTDNTRVLKTGDTISGTFAPSSDRGAIIGADNQRINYLWAYRVVGVTSIEKSANSGVYRQFLQDKTGNIALTSDIPDINTTSLGNNIYLPNASTWENYVTLSESIDNFRYIGFSWSGADNGGLAGLVDVFIDTGSFKQMSVNSPLPLIKDEYSPVDSRSLLIAYYDTTHIRVYRGSDVYQYHRLNIIGICRK